MNRDVLDGDANDDRPLVVVVVVVVVVIVVVVVLALSSVGFGANASAIRTLAAKTTKTELNNNFIFS